MGINIEDFTYRVMPQSCAEFGGAAYDPIAIDDNLMAAGLSVLRLLFVKDRVIETVVEDPCCTVVLADNRTFTAKGVG